MPIFYKEISSEFKSVTPFKLYKSWNFNTSSYNITSADPLIRIYDAPARYNTNLYNTNTSGSQSGSIWYSINQLYYGAGQDYKQLDVFSEHSFTTSSNAIVISIPNSKFGESISQKSVQFYMLASASIPYIADGNTAQSILIVDNGTGNLKDSRNTYFTSSIGNIDYKNGIIIITNESYYQYISTASFIRPTNTVSTLQYTSYYTAFEHEYACPVKSNEFNGTINGSAFQVRPDGVNVFRFSDIYDSTGEKIVFRPFATGIGLYDESNRLVVIAKFAKPVRIENDMDSIFTIRFDT